MNGTDVISVLVIEDDVDTRNTIAEFLSLGNFEWRVASNRDEGLKVLDAIEPDVILLDVMMPGLNMERFLLNAARKAPQARIILMSAFNILNEHADRFGLEHLPKPIEMDALFKTLEM